MDFAPAPAFKSVLGDKDVNAAIAAAEANPNNKDSGKDIKSMEYHRQVLQSKMEAEG